MKTLTQAMPLILSILVTLNSTVFADEVVPETAMRVIQRTHPKTGKNYFSVAPQGKTLSDPLGKANQLKKYPRPDYKMLDPKIKPSQIKYEGPYSDRKKVYAFAAGVAAVGTIGGALTMATAASSTATASAGGAGAYMAGGTAVATGTISTAMLKSRPNPNDNNYKHDSKSTVLAASEKGKAAIIQGADSAAGDSATDDSETSD